MLRDGLEMEMKEQKGTRAKAESKVNGGVKRNKRREWECGDGRQKGLEEWEKKGEWGKR